MGVWEVCCANHIRRHLMRRKAATATDDNSAMLLPLRDVVAMECS